MCECTLRHQRIRLKDMTLTEILQKAAERARQLGLPYSGALTPQSSAHRGG